MMRRKVRRGQKATTDSKGHLQLLRMTSGAFRQAERSLDYALTVGLECLLKDSNYDSAYIYLYDENTNCLECSQTIARGKGAIVGEGRLPVTERQEDKISQVYLGKLDHFIWNNRINICVAIGRFKERLGVIIADKELTKVPIAEGEATKLHDFTDEFALGINNLRSYLNAQRQLNRFLTFAKISTAITSTMKLEEMLTIILRSAIDELGFDRVKLLLINKETNLLEGKLVADVRGVFQAIESERYPLREGVNRLVDAALGKAGSHEDNDEISRLIFNMPLEVRGNIIGVMAVENIFSRKPVLKEDLENIKIFGNQAALAIENARLFQKVEELSIHDGLTGLYVYRYFKQRLEEEVRRAKRFDEEFSLMIVDIDDFKKYNDTYGHPVGDKILQELSKILLRNVRALDIVGRYGGDEFVVILPKLSRLKARDVALRIHRAIGEHRYHIDDKPMSFTVSIGIASFPEISDTAEGLIKKADEALYLAKQHGKNQVRLA